MRNDPNDEKQNPKMVSLLSQFALDRGLSHSGSGLVSWPPLPHPMGKEPFYPTKVLFHIPTSSVSAVTLLFTLCSLKKVRKMAHKQSSAAAVRTE